MEFENNNLQTSDIIQFIKRSHLFRGLTDDELEKVAGYLQVMPYPGGRILVKQGSVGSKFYMVYSGGLMVKQDQGEKLEKQFILGVADHLGEEMLFDGSEYSVTATTMEDSIFLVLNSQNAAEMFSQIDPVKSNFETARDNQLLVKKAFFKWLQTDEVVYFLARKHPIILWKAMIPPLLLLIGPLYLFVYALNSSSTLPLALAIFLMVVCIVWFIWARVDWGNDHYLVTNKRVIWLEKVIGFYDSRQEAPLNTILSVGVETSILGRWLNFGDVIVKTFVGQIFFRHVHRPGQAASLVEEHWVRSQEQSRRVDGEVMKETMRVKLGFTNEQKSVPAQSPQSIQTTVKPGWVQIWFSDIFKTRLEYKGTITYRKHWLVLIKNTWVPGLLSLMLIMMLLYQFLYLPLSGTTGSAIPVSLDKLIGGMLFILFGVFGWWLYNYLDWRNDIYQVTPEQIFDIKKRPLGREESQVAPLDNILSTEYKRIGLMQVLFNYGNVYITVGGSELVFEDVADPVTVQMDIDLVRLSLIESKKDKKNREERDRMADLLAAYHNDPLTNTQRLNTIEDIETD